MGRNWFALASFTALTGVAIFGSATGCSSTTSNATGDDGGSGSTPPKKNAGDKATSPNPPPPNPPPPPPPGDDGGTTKKDAGGRDGGDAGGDDGGAGACPTTNPIDPSTLPYEAPAAPQTGACTEAELTAIGAAVASAKNDNDLKAAVSSACAACIFTDVSKAPWGPLPEVAAAGGPQAATVDLGGCYETMTASATCGKAIQNHLDCQFQACDGCPAGDPAASSTCIKKADTGACRATVTAEQTACAAVASAALTAADSACVPPGGRYLFEGPIRVACIQKP